MRDQMEITVDFLVSGLSLQWNVELCLELFSLSLLYFGSGRNCKSNVLFGQFQIKCGCHVVPVIK